MAPMLMSPPSSVNQDKVVGVERGDWTAGKEDPFAGYVKVRHPERPFRPGGVWPPEGLVRRKTTIVIGRRPGYEVI